MTSSLVAAVSAIAICGGVSAQAEDLTWSGATNGVWSTDSGATNWTDDSAEIAFTSGDNVTFSGAGLGVPTIILAENISAGSVTVTESGYVLQSATSGNYTLQANSLTLDDERTDDAAHTFTIAENTAVSVGTFTESSGQMDLVVNGSLEVSGEMHVNSSQDESISGSGTISVGSLLYDARQGESFTILVKQAHFGTITETTGGGEQDSEANFRTIVIGDGTNATAATADRIYISSNSQIEVAANSTLSVGTFSDTSGYHTKIVGDGTFTADSMTFNGANGEMTFAVANAVVGTFDNTGTHKVVVAESSNLTTGSLTRTGNVLTLEVDGTLNVTKSYGDNDNFGTGLLSFEGSSDFGYPQYLSGSGTVNAYGIHYRANNKAWLEVSVANLNIGEAGITKVHLGSFKIKTTTVGLYETDNLTLSADLWLDGGSEGTKFKPTEGQQLTLSGVISGSGALVKIGAGDLTLSATNTYTGGTTISEGTVVAAHNNALGTGSVAIAGGQLEVGAGVTFANAISVVLDDSYIIGVGGADGISAFAATGGYAITGAGVLNSAITISVDGALDNLGSGVYEFGIVDPDLAGTATINMDALIDAGFNASYENGVITITVPEPAMFGFVAGLVAVATLATKRRRRCHRKA
ncbi:MAG: autotransporter-associated beta strand repeat-containing protein [Opitutae bacterium]|nr:autotransporter-associated beta strand repeat-containing protein [Opitutae bacterium]MCD8299223.1 autotransporter-associated beta strand repeat-containing protein [Opitutae bacterium]